ncbi:MAG TPA: IMS domain-containing protein [Nostocaceae cyanobacterium]|nr:IMS domain-containing protein [Nostocaceae cyanobacterium]
MRIPLDYYRILGLPLAASEEQLRQAYGDRIVQLPRREYSTAAISSRKQLIEEAYVVLSNPQERSVYDQLYLAHIYDADNLAGTATAENPVNHDAQNLSIEISAENFVGSLLLLQELGEYELVLKLGRPYLVKKNSPVGVKTGHNFTSEEDLDNAELADIVLTVTLACLELGREQWQQGHYENAAISLETGEELLAREGLFPNVRSEIIADLYKLRPYRILELLALPEEKSSNGETSTFADRRQGLELLQSILDDRGGIDGTGNDQSGLNIDDFLRFIQQIRYYLTVAEQHKLFEAESRRPSAVSTYLAVYALIARGFAQRQPALIRQAKQMLMRLGKRQDVHLEQSLCALLLGQTEEATRVLELSQEYEALAFIREKSLDSPDLLPGLCLYGEQWLQQEVFPHFRDLAKQQASLKDYFADYQVQAYLEALPTDAEMTNEWAVINRQSFSHPQVSNHTYRNNSTGIYRQSYTSYTPDSEDTSTNDIPEYSHISPSQQNNRNASKSRVNPTTRPPVVELPTTEPQFRGSEYRMNGRNPASNPPLKRRRRKPTSANAQQQRVIPRKRNFANTLESKTRLVWLVLVALVSLLVLTLLISTTVGWVRSTFFPQPSLQGQQLVIEINQPPVLIPDQNSQPQPPQGEITNATAEEVIQAWLTIKAAALGQNHQIESLDQILTGAPLSQWKSVVEQERAKRNYRKYQHNLKVESVNKIGLNSDTASVVATVKEVTEYYERGQRKRSSEENLRVRYDLVRKEGVWRIQKMSVVENLNG